MLTVFNCNLSQKTMVQKHLFLGQKQHLYFPKLFYQMFNPFINYSGLYLYALLSLMYALVIVTIWYISLFLNLVYFSSI